MKKAVTKWALKDANKVTKWDKRIRVIDQFPYFKNISRDPACDVQIKRWMDLIYKSNVQHFSHESLTLYGFFLIPITHE
jgi:hypothetical protein